MMNICTASSRSSKYPFTASQWQELEQQALIYKYMVSGMPIPPDLLFTVRRNFDSSLSSKLFPYQPSSIGWNPYQMSYGGKKIDPEPGRCRRTDGKKWRCSKEAYPDSKYCEKHMHRGKNRSRKPVENTTSSALLNQTIASPNITKSPNSTSTTFHSLSPCQPVGSSSDNTKLHHGCSHDHHHAASSFDSHILFPHSSTCRPPGNIDLSSQDKTAHLPFDSGSLRGKYVHAVKEDLVAGEHAFFTEETSKTIRPFSTSSSIDEAWHQQHLGHASLDHTKQYTSDLQSGYAYLKVKTDISQQEKQNQELHIWGRDFSSSEPSHMPMEADKNQPQKTIHHFLDDSSTTQLSISMPTSSYDFFLSS